MKKIILIFSLFICLTSLSQEKYRFTKLVSKTLNGESIEKVDITVSYSKESGVLTIFNSQTNNTRNFNVSIDFPTEMTKYMDFEKFTKLNSDYHKTSFIFYERPFRLEIRYPNKTSILRP